MATKDSRVRNRYQIAEEVAYNRLVSYLIDTQGLDRKGALYLASKESRDNIAQLDKIYRKFYLENINSYSIRSQIDFELVSKELRKVSRNNILTSSIDLQNIALLSLNGESLRKIAEKYNTNQQTVARRLDFIEKYSKIQLRSRG